MKRNHNFEIMAKLARTKNLRQAVKWLGTDIESLGKTPAEIMKVGMTPKTFVFLTENIKPK